MSLDGDERKRKVKACASGSGTMMVPRMKKARAGRAVF
jgi:hypothetical protein